MPLRAQKTYNLCLLFVKAIDDVEWRIGALDNDLTGVRGKILQ
jgi:hypothetical protein